MTIELDPQDKKRIEELSRESGMEPEDFARQILHEALESWTENGTASSTDQQDAAWKKFLAAGVEWSKRVKVGHTADDSREGIYSGRGE